MFIKLLCIENAGFVDPYEGKHFIIEEGKTVGAFIDNQGVHIEYENNRYSLPYQFEDVGKHFISAFDDEAYDKIYQKVSDCKMHFENGTIFELGNAIVKIT